jgi:hypothetical protein
MLACDFLTVETAFLQRVIGTPVRAPNANAYAERWVSNGARRLR